MVAERWGLPVALMLLMGVGVFFLARKGLTIADKLANSHIALIDALKDLMPKVKERADEADEKLDELKVGLRELKDELRRLRS